jgi:hypothetical protein
LSIYINKMMDAEQLSFSNDAKPDDYTPNFAAQPRLYKSAT